MLQTLVNTVPGVLLPFVVVGGYMAVALVIAWLIHKIHAQVTVSEKVGDHLKQVFNIAATMLALVIGFIVVTVWQQYSHVQQNVVNEANAAQLLHRQSNLLAEPAKNDLQRELSQYVASTIHQGWPLLATGEESSIVIKELDDIWDVITALPHQTADQTETRALLLDTLGEINTLYRTRIFDSRNVLPDYFWIILFVYSALIIAAANSIYRESFRLRLLTTSMLSFCIGLMFLLILFIDYPYSGDTKIQPAAFQYVLELMARP